MTTVMQLLLNYNEVLEVSNFLETIDQQTLAQEKWILWAHGK